MFHLISSVAKCFSLYAFPSISTISFVTPWSLGKPTAMQPGPIRKGEQTAIPGLPSGNTAATNLLLTDPDADVPASTLPLPRPADSVGNASPRPGLVAAVLPRIRNLGRLRMDGKNSGP